MKHQKYRSHKLTLRERFNNWLRGPRFLVVNPEFTKKHPGRPDQGFAIRKPEGVE